MKKKLFSILLAVIMCFGLCSCGQSEAAKSADDLIKAIGEVTLESEAKIIDAENAVAGLAEEDYKQIKRESELRAARENYENLVLKHEISIVEDKINAIGTVTLDSQQSIEAARKAFEKASKEVQEGVSNFAVIEAAEAKLIELRIEELEQKIDAIGEVTLDSQSTVNIKGARTSYKKASKEVQNGISNLAVLESAEAKLTELRISETERLIDAIGEVIPENQEKFNAAKLMYNKLSDAEKKNVSNANILNSVEAKFTELEVLTGLEQQDVRVISTKYIVQSDRWKALYPDVLQAVFQNDSQKDIKHAYIAFVAWDANNLPVRIKGTFDTSGSYVKKVKFADINLVPGSKHGQNGGYQIDDGQGIKTFKAMVLGYETFSGEVWENPLFDKWCALYEGVKLSS